MNLYYNRIGYPAESIAFLATVRPWIRAVSGPLFMMAADKSGKHRVLYIATSVAGMMIITSMGLTKIMTIQLLL